MSSIGPPAPPVADRAAIPPRIAKAAEDFTAVALNDMLSPMFTDVDASGGLLGGGAGEAAFRPMVINEFAKSLAHQGGLGLTQAVADAMLRLQETKP